MSNQLQKDVTNLQEYNEFMIRTILKEMNNVYLLFSLPFVVVDENGHIVDSGYKWQNQEAENCYNAYFKLLENLQKTPEASLNFPLETREDKAD